VAYCINRQWQAAHLAGEEASEEDSFQKSIALWSEPLQNQLAASRHLLDEGKQCYVTSGPPQGWVASCFCHRAGNLGCQGECTCGKTCGTIWPSQVSVTFPNIKKAGGCGVETALLTIPRSAFTDLWDLKGKCPQGMQPLLTALLIDGFQAYQAHGAPGPVQQCVHNPGHVTVKWLHLHSFCVGGYVDGMPLSPPQTNGVAYCQTMQSTEDAVWIAEQIVKWVR